MGAVTYPDSSVRSLLDERFVCFKVNTKETTAETRQVMADHRLLWEPGFVFLEPRGSELRRNVGFIPPPDFLDELRLVLGKVHLLYGRFEDAQNEFLVVGQAEPARQAAPEALFWAGIAGYRAEGNDLETLEREWKTLEERFPENLWWKRADVFGPEAES